MRSWHGTWSGCKAYHFEFCSGAVMVAGVGLAGMMEMAVGCSERLVG